MAPALLETLSTTAEPMASKMPAQAEQQEPWIMHRSMLEQPVEVDSASGIYLHLANGRTIIDACGGAAVAIIGHGNAEVVAATTAQMQKVSYVHTLSYTTASAENLARCLLEGNPYRLEKAFFVGSGSEANDSALKLARQYFFELGQPKRKHFIARRQGYHGNSIASMSISSNLARRIPYNDAILLPHVSFVSPAFGYRYQHASESEAAFSQRLVAELEDEILRVGPETVAAFVAEPVVGATCGAVVAPAGYYEGVRAVCDKYGVLLLLDEVMCGMGRTGTYFAFEQEGIVPDIVTIGKGLGGGYAPIAAVLMGKKVVDGLRAGTGAFNHGHTYQAHAVSCATALAVQTVVKREKLVENCARMGAVLEKLLRETFAESKYVGDVRGRGLFWAVEFVKDRSTKETFDPRIAFGYRVQKATFDAGVAVYPGACTVDGVVGDHVLLAPPYNITEEQLLVVVEALKTAYDAQEKAVDKLSI